MCSQPRKQTVYCADQKKYGQQVEGEDSASLPHSGETPPGVLRPAVKPSAQERHGAVGPGPEEAIQMI